MQKQYNLATPELISKLWEVGAIAERHNQSVHYRVIVDSKHVPTLNELLTGRKFYVNSKNTAVIYSKDVWNALLTYNDRRNTYGHTDEVIPTTSTHCGMPVQSFTFSDGGVIRKCAFTYCTHFDLARQRVLRAPMMGVR